MISFYNKVLSNIIANLDSVSIFIHLEHFLKYYNKVVTKVVNPVCFKVAWNMLNNICEFVIFILKIDYNL